ncbi:pentatricopeptide repeat-containing protein At2g18940, chloroplastic-like [Selaginella moellendorffii]|uniref:pentatricopeptide repeat-containing protein At2g18940, chloroplastic-like n=1 Tax=Selaginella moellendorffii TaxID=88036 RepID=UPI000D1C9DAD|nr:pentatricopeptide repeat-containing protein At2g18940, chloroplastic-like [Selaginella moellendorffii]|eukprot:XP_024520471.1 pentatricopeptide repeat-containing protein At2g18940, chloroplastic-like [Selaginella moellendorffii]
MCSFLVSYLFVFSLFKQKSNWLGESAASIPGRALPTQDARPLGRYLVVLSRWPSRSPRRSYLRLQGKSRIARKVLQGASSNPRRILRRLGFFRTSMLTGATRRLHKIVGAVRFVAGLGFSTQPSPQGTGGGIDNVAYHIRHRKRKPRKNTIDVSTPPAASLDTQLVNQVVAVLNDTVYLEDLDEKLDGVRTKLSSPRDVAMVLKLVRDTRLANGFFDWARKQGDVPLNLDTALTMLHRLLVARKWGALNSLVDWMHDNSFYLDFGLFEAVIKEASDAQQVEVCEKWYGLMQQINVAPNSFICNLMIRVYSRDGRGMDALKIFQDMEDSKVRPTVVTYSQLFSVCKEIPGSSSIVRTLLNRMKLQGIKLDKIAYTSLMNVYAKAGQTQQVEDLFQSMAGCQIQPDIYLLNCVLESYVRAGKLEEAVRVFDDCILGSGNRPNEASYVIMLGLYCKAGLYDKALELLKTIDHDSVKLGEQFFITLIKAFSAAQCWDDTIAVFKEMQCSSCRIRGSVYVELLEVCFKAGYYDSCVEFFAAVLDKGVNRTPGVYETMIRAYEQMGQMEEISHVFVYMQDMLCPFTASVYDLLHGIFTRTENVQMLEALENVRRAGKLIVHGL